MSAGRLLHCTFRGLLSVHVVTTYKLTRSPSRPSTPEASAASLPSPPLRLLPGGANQFPGGTSTRCGPAPCHGARHLMCYRHLSNCDLTHSSDFCIMLTLLRPLHRP